MAASPSILRHSHQGRSHVQSATLSPSHSPVPPVASQIPNPRYPSLNIFQGPSPSHSSPNFQTFEQAIDRHSQHGPTALIDSRRIKTVQLSSWPLSSRSNPTSSSNLSLKTPQYNLSDSSLRHPSLSTIKMLSQQKKSNPGCLPLTSTLAPPSLVDACASAPPPSSAPSSRKKAKTRLHLSSLPQFSHPQLQSSSPNTTILSDTRAYISAQQQLQFHQKDLIQQATRGTLPSHLLFPVSPRLIPCGSPGPVTPLTLEESSGYLTASSTSSSSPGSLNIQFLPQMEMDKLSAIAAAQT